MILQEHTLDLGKYTLLGFDFRIPCSQPQTVDSCLWQQATHARQQVFDLGYSENIAQLMECPASVIEEYAQEDAIGVAIAVSPEGLEKMVELLGGSFIDQPLSPDYLLRRNWKFQGYDLADCNGYFSIFGMDCTSPQFMVGKSLFANEHEAEAMLAPANRQYPEHAPFAIFAVLTYQYAD